MVNVPLLLPWMLQLRLPNDGLCSFLIGTIGSSGLAQFTHLLIVGNGFWEREATNINLNELVKHPPIGKMTALALHGHINFNFLALVLINNVCRGLESLATLLEVLQVLVFHSQMMMGKIGLRLEILI